jgi:hypothetical protein
MSVGRFDALDRERQLELIAYEQLRDEEERLLRRFTGCPFLGG